MADVSVIIPTYNSAQYVAAAVESVFAQTAGEHEIVVVDDGSTDDTAGALRPYRDRIRYVRQENSGVAVARNRGVASSSAPWVGFLDADDTWLPEKSERQLRALREAPGARACYAAFVAVDAELRPIGVRRSDRRASALEDLLLRGNVVGSICTVLCDRELFLSTGGFDPELSQCADWDMWVRLAASTEFLYVDEPLVTYRQHATNMSKNAPLLEYDSLKVLDKGFGMPALPESIGARRSYAYARNYTVLAGTYFHARSYASAIRCAAKAVALDAGQAQYLASFPGRVVGRIAGKGGAGAQA